MVARVSATFVVTLLTAAGLVLASALPVPDSKSNIGRGPGAFEFEGRLGNIDNVNTPWHWYGRRDDDTSNGGGSDASTGCEEYIRVLGLELCVHEDTSSSSALSSPSSSSSSSTPDGDQVDHPNIVHVNPHDVARDLLDSDGGADSCAAPTTGSAGYRGLDEDECIPLTESELDSLRGDDDDNGDDGGADTIA